MASGSEQQSNNPSGQGTGPGPSNLLTGQTSTAGNKSQSETGGGARRQALRRATDYLNDAYKLQRDQDRHRGYRRMAQLRKDEMFDNLVELYSTLFRAHWHSFSRLPTAAHNQAGMGAASIHLARAYIGAWFWDLYVCIRESLKTTSQTAFAAHYGPEIGHLSTEYDTFLVMLNAMIRPTTVYGTLEESMFIPLLVSRQAFTDQNNPFDIVNYEYSLDYIHGVIGVMKDRKEWKVETLMGGYAGSAPWLLDWWEDRAHAFFPQEGNYSDDDLTLAYIVGIAMTPKLAPREMDAWQTFPGMIAPIQPNWRNYNRAHARTFFGAVEETEIEMRNVYRILKEDGFGNPEGTDAYNRTQAELELAMKAAAETSGGAVVQFRGSSRSSRSRDEYGRHPVPQFKLTTYVYYRQVIRRTDIQTRVAALKYISMN